jgi:hypothetical protein
MTKEVFMSEQYDLIVVGGGLAGTCAAIAAARLGCRVALVQNRPVLGGNSSSEIRVPVGGACDFNPWARETGLLEEFFLEDRFQDTARIWTGHGSSTWDYTLYKAAANEKSLDLYIDTPAQKVLMSKTNPKLIDSIVGYENGSEKEIVLKGRLFIDATGDGVIAYQAGAEFRMGREARSEFKESLAPEKADSYTQGSSLLFHARDVGFPVPFSPPKWVPQLSSDEDLAFRTHHDVEAGYWWIEIGNPPYHTIADHANIRKELIKMVLAVWNHIKNHGDHQADHLVLDWIGMVPGKRESRRIMGDYIMKEKDVTYGSLFDDRVAYGGWFVDIHTPGGILAKDLPPEPSFPGKSEEIGKRQATVYSIPFRSLYSKDIPNLMMAGRDISVTHVALGTTRLMGTCSTIGQAAGTAAYLCTKYSLQPRDLYPEKIHELQQLLLKQDGFIPQIKNSDPKDLARDARITASSSAKLQIAQGDLATEYDHPRQRTISMTGLETERALIFPITSDHIDSIDLYIESHLHESAEIEVTLKKAMHIWDYDGSEGILTKQKVAVPPSGVSWVKVPFNLSVDPKSFYIITARSQTGIFWRYHKKPPVGTAALSKEKNKWTSTKGAYTIRIYPEVFPYETENILSGVSRPENWTNIWISDPSQGMPQTVTLEFPVETTFNTVYLTFDTNLTQTHMSTPPLYLFPECVKDYALFFDAQATWKEILHCHDNYQRRRIHRFSPITTQKLQIEIYATHGDPSARIYEIRVYNE